MKSKIAAFYHVREKMDLIERKRSKYSESISEIESALKQICSAAECVNKICSENDMKDISHLLRGMVNELEERKFSLSKKIRGSRKGRKKLKKQFESLAKYMEKE